VKTGSFCSGICAPEKAWESLGWEPLFFSEIDPFASALEFYRFPGVRNFGDMRAVRDALVYGPRVIRRRMRKGKPWEETRDWLREMVRLLRSIDLLVAGTPCQAFSVAGNRGSLCDDRGNLTLVFTELVHAIDPRIVVWENVPGVLSVKDNAFGCFLAGLVGEGSPLPCRGGTWPNAGMVVGPRRSAAWRVLDAQHFGVPQRRRRVFVVSFRTRDGVNPGAVLFEPESLPRDSAPGREAGARVAASLTRGADSGGKGGYAGRRREDDSNIVGFLNSGGNNGGFRTEPGEHLVPGPIPDVCPAIKARDCKGPSSDGDGDGAILVPMLAHSLRGDGFDASEDGTGRGTPLVPVAFAERGSNVSVDGDVAATMKASGDNTGGRLCVAFDWQSGGDARGLDPKPTAQLQRHQIPAIAIQERAVETNTNSGPQGKGYQENIAYTLEARHRPQNVAAGMAVRRLTPRECEKLQGFPDDWTLVPLRGKPMADGPRYRCIGNSMAVPVLTWIGERIVKVEAAFAARREEKP
jgi:DNA (cytosine-5)-methyltransferase 1